MIWSPAFAIAVSLCWHENWQKLVDIRTLAPNTLSAVCFPVSSGYHCYILLAIQVPVPNKHAELVIPSLRAQREDGSQREARPQRQRLLSKNSLY